jgi:hypothetical protein
MIEIEILPLDNAWLYLASGTIPVSNDFLQALWHRFSRVIFIYLWQDLSPLMNKGNNKITELTKTESPQIISFCNFSEEKYI